MKIAFASGKGGTGKTTLSVNLAYLFSEKSSVRYMDFDVEEPNGHLYFRPEIKHSVHVNVLTPVIDDNKCVHCGLCADFCFYRAIASLPGATLIFPELCHSCGGCRLICPYGAITEKERRIGIIERGISGTVDFVHGKLDVGQAMSAPLIRALRPYAAGDELVIIDSPPGANCSTMATLLSVDAVVLTAEPTPFGLNDLKIVVDMVRAVGKPFGVIINRYGAGDDSLENWCAGEGIPIWGRIPDDLEIARYCSRGLIASRESRSIGEYYNNAARNLAREVMS